jgi:DNA-directed RNA polymerase specialized sigma24 family protein
MATAKKLNDSYQNFLESNEVEELLVTVRESVVAWFDGLMPNDCEDIAHDTMLKVWRSLPNYPGNDALSLYVDGGNFSGFVATIANNLRKDFVKNSFNSDVAKYDEHVLEVLVEGTEYVKEEAIEE